MVIPLVTARPSEYVIGIEMEDNMISFPVNDTIDTGDVIINYNNSNYTWNQAIQYGLIWDEVWGWNPFTQQDEQAFSFEGGRGYWVQSNVSCTFSIVGTSTDGYITYMYEEWNRIGIPLNEEIPIEFLTFKLDNGTKYTWEQAEKWEIIIPFVYGWNVEEQEYDVVDVIQPGQGYWMYAYYNCTVRYEPE